MINSVVNQYFGAVVSCIEAHGGDVIKFAGDALIVEWATLTEPDRPGSEPGLDNPGARAEAGAEAESAVPSPSARSGHAALAGHAARCALALSQLEARHPAGMRGELALHTALACGTVAAMHVGGVGGRFEFFITGEVRRDSPRATLDCAAPLPSDVTVVGSTNHHQVTYTESLETLSDRRCSLS